MKRPKPFVLVILDGWGISDTKPSAVTRASIPNFRRLMNEYPRTTLGASGESVGLMPGQMGDSNVGHLNIGAGHIVYQDLVRIFRDIRDGAFFKNPSLLGALENAKKNNSRLHLMGLLSDGGVHSHQEHLYALLQMAKGKGLKKVLIHAFLDGRDVPPTSAQGYLEALEEKVKEIGVGALGSITGRYYAMDRDKRWDRTEKAYRVLTFGQGRKAISPVQALKAAYEQGETDEFVSPTVIEDSFEPVSDGDSVIFFNFRADRARQITRAFTDDQFDYFQRNKKPPIFFCGMVKYEEDLNGVYAYTPVYLKNTLGEVISKEGLRQLRIAETEKYAHVTFFFSGKREEPFPSEDRCLIPSPKVATYDLKPEMSAFEVTSEAVRRIESGQYDLIVLNYANPDMVGHTGVFEAGVKALEAVDQCLGKLLEAVTRVGGCALVIADHGNIEELTPLKKAGEESHTYHSTNPVPCVLVQEWNAGVMGSTQDVSNSGCVAGRGKPFGKDSNEDSKVKLREGILADVAPTVLDIMGLPKPLEMDRESLIVKR